MVTAAVTVAAFVVPGASAVPAQAADATSSYVAITPSRIADTRSGAPIDANTTRDFQITGSLVPATATAVVLNVTATRSQGNGFLQVFPTGRQPSGRVRP